MTMIPQMIFKLFRIIALLSVLIFTTGFIPLFSILGPGWTILSSGNFYKATTQFLIDQSVKNAGISLGINNLLTISYL